MGVLALVLVVTLFLRVKSPLPKMLVVIFILPLVTLTEMEMVVTWSSDLVSHLTLLDNSVFLKVKSSLVIKSMISSSLVKLVMAAVWTLSLLVKLVKLLKVVASSSTLVKEQPLVVMSPCVVEIVLSTIPFPLPLVEVWFFNLLMLPLMAEVFSFWLVRIPRLLEPTVISPSPLVMLLLRHLLLVIFDSTLVLEIPSVTLSLMVMTTMLLPLSLVLLPSTPLLLSLTTPTLRFKRILRMLFSVLIPQASSLTMERVLVIG